MMSQLGVERKLAKTTPPKNQSQKMFQQFRKLIPTTNINFKDFTKDLTRAVGLNEEELKSKGLESFQTVRSELQSLNALLLNLPPPSRPEPQQTEPPKQWEEKKTLDLTATLELTARFETDLEDVHKRNQDNSRRAAQADELIHQLLAYCNAQFDTYELLQHEARELPQMKQSLEELTQSAVSLKGRLTALETLIDEMSVGFEARQFKKWKAEQEANFKKYKEDKNQAFEVKSVTLDRQYREHARDQAARRLELYQSNFEAEVQDYMRRKETEVQALDAGVPFHAIPPAPFTKMATNPFPALESLSLQDQAHDRGELDSFLEEDGVEARTVSSSSLSSLSSLIIHQDAEGEDDEDDAPAAGLVLADEDYGEG